MSPGMRSRGNFSRRTNRMTSPGKQKTMIPVTTRLRPDQQKRLARWEPRDPTARAGKSRHKAGAHVLWSDGLSANVAAWVGRVAGPGAAERIHIGRLAGPIEPQFRRGHQDPSRSDQPKHRDHHHQRGRRHYRRYIAAARYLRRMIANGAY